MIANHVGAAWGKTRARALQTQLLVTLALLAAGPLLALGALFARVAENAEIARADRETLLATSSLARELGRVIEAHANVARSFAGEIGRGGVVDAAHVGGKTAHYLTSFPGLYGFYVLDRAGVTVDGSIWSEGPPRSIVGTAYGDRRWFREVRDGAPFASELLRSRTTKRPGVILIAPIRDASGTFLGVVGAGIDLDAVQSALERVGDAAPGLAAVVIDASGGVVAATRNVHAQPLEPLGTLDFYRPATASGPEPRSGRDEDGVLRRGTAAKVESSVVTWSVITSWPQSAVRRRTVHALLTTAGFAAVALALALAVAVILSRQLARPVAQLSTLVEAIGRGDLRASPRARDRLSPREIIELEQSISGMLARLKGVIVQLGRTVIAVRAMSERLHDASSQMLADSRAQQDAGRNASLAIVQINDSIGDVGTSVRGLSDTASQTASSITGLDAQIGQIASSLQELDATITSALQHVDQMQEQMAAIGTNTSQLGQSVSDTSASLKALTESIRGVAGRAEYGRGLARNALSAAQAGQAAVHETIEATHEIQRRFSAIERAVHSLAGRSEDIGEVAGIIEEVMRAIRLVGINASIIAAVAGEYGHGFGVVADRVRSLAAETAGAIDRITKLVASVQSDILQVVEATRHGQQVVAVGEKRSEEAGVRLEAIIESSADAERTTNEIAEATREQTEGVGVVLSALGNVREATEHIQRAVRTQHETQKSMAATIGHVRAVGAEVHRSTRTQQTQSAAMTADVRAMTDRFREIARSVETQGHDRERIEAALAVFAGASRISVERAGQIGEVVLALRDRLDQLERDLGAFRVDDEYGRP